MNVVKINTNYFINKDIEYVLNYYKIGKKAIYNIMQNRRLLVNNNPVTLSHIIKKDDDVVFIDEEMIIIPYKQKIEVIYENEYIIIVNKPTNILVHSDGNTYETLQNAVSNYLYENKKPIFCQAVHRLDYETTGLVVFAKNSLALSFLSYAFENKMVHKEYICLVKGKVNPPKGSIEKPIGKDRHSNKQIIYTNGKLAKTLYETISYKQGISKLKINIIGGRKHQIRVHLYSIGHPIIGDKIYANDMDEQLKLHARRISFIDPQTCEKIEIETKETF